MVLEWMIFLGMLKLPTNLKYLNKLLILQLQIMHYSILSFLMLNRHSEMCEYPRPLAPANPSAEDANEITSIRHHFLTVQQYPSFLTLSLLSLHYNRKIISLPLSCLHFVCSQDASRIFSKRNAPDLHTRTWIGMRNIWVRAQVLAAGIFLHPRIHFE